MQQIPETGKSELSDQRVITALTQLSAFALRGSMLHFTSPESTERLAEQFFNRLLALCEVPQGALFFTQRYQTPFAEDSRQAVLAQVKPFFVAGTGLSAEEAYSALAISTPMPDKLPAFGELPPVLAWKRPLDVISGQTPSAGDASCASVAHSSAQLLFVWPAAEQRTRAAAQARMLLLLPFLADLVDTILLHLTMTFFEKKPVQEVFPAELLTTVGHELRSPLTTIQGYATTLLRHDQQLAVEERRDFLHTISEASAHLGKLIDRFLELAQFESQTHTFVPVSLDLLALTRESITSMQKRRQRYILLVPALMEADELTISASAPSEQLIVGDRRLLRMMLDVLLENAVAYSAPESLVEIAIEAVEAAWEDAPLPQPPGPDTHLALVLPATFQPHEPLLAIRVRDHGMGIAPDQLLPIFRRFYRVDTRLTRNVSGLGLGLALCKAIVARHRGMLWVESAVGVGSTFCVVLPRDLSTATDGIIKKQLKKRMD